MARNPDPLRLNAALVTKDGIPTRDFATFLEMVWRQVIQPFPEPPPIDPATVYYNASGQFTKPQRSAVTALSIDAGVVKPDLSAGTIFTVTASSNFTLANPDDLAEFAGQEILIVITQASTYTIALGSAYKFPAETNAKLTTGNGAIDAIAGTVIDGGKILCAFLPNFAAL